MSLLTINGKLMHSSQINPSTLSSGNTTTTISTNGNNYTTIPSVYTTTPSYLPFEKRKFILLGEEIEVDEDWTNAGINKTYIQIISSINILGYKYFEELKKNGFDFSDEVGIIIEKRMISLKRESYIDEIMGEKRSKT